MKAVEVVFFKKIIPMIGADFACNRGRTWDEYNSVTIPVTAIKGKTLD